MIVVGAADKSGKISEADLLRVTKIAETFLYVIDQYSKDGPLKSYDALLALLIAGKMAAMHTKSEDLYQQMLEEAVKDDLFALVDVTALNDVAGNA